MQRIIYDAGFRVDGKPVTKLLKGIIISSDLDFIDFRTANKTYKIAKSRIIEIASTDEVFVEKDGGNDDGEPEKII